jgi:hypothetical protein
MTPEGLMTKNDGPTLCTVAFFDHRNEVKVVAEVQGQMKINDAASSK